MIPTTHQTRTHDRLAARSRSRPASWPSRPTAPSSSGRATRWCSSRPATPRTPRVGIDFLPLTVDYREYTYASGRIPGGFFKREGKPAEKEVLTSRLIDRPIRPLFPGGWRYETQIVALLISADTENDSDVLAITGASAALVAVVDSVPEDDRRRARRPDRRRVRHQPDLSRAPHEQDRSDRGRQRRRHHDGRGRAPRKPPRKR